MYNPVTIQTLKATQSLRTKLYVTEYEHSPTREFKHSPEITYGDRRPNALASTSGGHSIAGGSSASLSSALFPM